MKIRNATMDDFDAIRDLILRCSEDFILPRLPEDGVRSYLESHSVEKMRERLREFDYHVLVDAGDRIVGVAGVRKPAHLVHLHILPELHGKGLGRNLWFAARDAFLEANTIADFTVNSSLFAIEFYRKLGFVGEEIETRDGVSYVPMTMKL